MYDEPTNEERRTRAENALAFYVKSRGEQLENSVDECSDIVCDLMHYVAKNFDEEAVERMLRQARSNFNEEHMNPEHER